jgi:hypothetical protein
MDGFQAAGKRENKGHNGASDRIEPPWQRARLPITGVLPPFISPHGSPGLWSKSSPKGCSKGATPDPACYNNPDAEASLSRCQCSETMSFYPHLPGVRSTGGLFVEHIFVQGEADCANNACIHPEGRECHESGFLDDLHGRCTVFFH